MTRELDISLTDSIGKYRVVGGYIFRTDQSIHSKLLFLTVDDHCLLAVDTEHSITFYRSDPYCKLGLESARAGSLALPGVIT